MPDKITVAAIVGPTASGKTRLAVDIARRFDGEVISADSMQIYRHMDIGTAKPDESEMRGVPHHLMSIIEPWERFSVARFTALARDCIRDVAARGRLPVIAGGTGLYIDSLLNAVCFGEMEALPEYRQELDRLADERGAGALHALLESCDPESAERLHPNDRIRIIRALEVFRSTGVSLTEWNRRSKLSPSPYEAVLIGLNYQDRSLLYRRIDQRVDDMLERGLLEEVRKLLAMNIGRNSTAMQAIGYKELAAYLDGGCSYDEAVERIKRESRRYAKRQLTWFRRNQSIHWIDIDHGNYEIILNNAKNILEIYV